MHNKLKSIAALLLSGAMLFTTSCKEDETVDPGKEEAPGYSIAMAVGSGSSSTTYVQSQEDFEAGKIISFENYGFEVPSTRTARIFTSSDGTSLYDLDYGGGRVYKFDSYGGENYQQVSETNVEYAIGTTHPRWTQLNDDYAMLHYVATENVEDSLGNVSKSVTARVMSISLQDLDIQNIMEFEMPSTGESGNDYVGRIDAPVVVGDKVYYGLSRSGFDPLDPDERVTATNTNVETLVLDYPKLTNPKIISTTAGGAKGATNGYRTPVCHVDENDDVYQIVTTLSEDDNTFILKISNGDYDDSYSFDLSTALGQDVRAYGWFYVGNGIGYVPYANLAIEGDGNYSVARVDVYNKTAIEMNVPENLWLRQYQSGAVIDGKFHMALAPLGEEGNVYIFDPESTSADGFTLGAKLKTGADAYYIGIY